MKKHRLLFVLPFFAFLFMTACEPVKNDKFIGLQLYSLRDLMKEAPKPTIKAVGEMGYAFVEAAGYSDGLFYGMPPAEFKTLVEESGMVFLGSHTGQNLPDSATYSATMEWWDQAIAAHKEAGVKYIVQPWMSKEGYESLEGLKAYCDYFNAVGEKCNEAGIRFGYHNHNKEFTTLLDGEPVYDFMVKNTDPEKVMFQLDLYWIIKGEKDPVEYFNTYPGRFWLWHVKDEKEVGASGDIDFENIWKHTEVSGVEYFIVEQEDYDFPPLQSVEKSLDYLLEADFVE